MHISLTQPLAPPAQLIPWLRERLPSFRYEVKGGKLVIVSGSFVAVRLDPVAGGVNVVGLSPPGLGARLVLGLGYAMGALPGVLFRALMMKSARGDWARVHRQLTYALHGRPIPPGLGIPPNSPYLAQGVDAIVAAGGPQSTISPWAPRGLLLALGPLITLSFVGLIATGIGWSFTGKSGDSLERAQAKVAVAKKNLAWRKKSDEPPTGACSEKKLDPQDFSKGVCHGCSVFDEEPFADDDPDHHGYSSKEKMLEAKAKYTILERDGAWWQFGDRDSFEDDVDRAERSMESSQEIHDSNVFVAMIFTIGFALLFLATIVVAISWRVKNLKLVAKRTKEIGDQQRMLDDAIARGYVPNYVPLEQV